MNIKSGFPRTNKPCLIGYLDTFLEHFADAKEYFVLMDGGPTRTRVISLTVILRRGINSR